MAEADVPTLSSQFLSLRNDLRGVDVASEWRLLLTEEEIQNRVKQLAKKIDELFVGKDIVFTCILKGAVYFLVDLSRYVTIPHSLYFIEASSYQSSQQQSEKVEVLSNLVPSKFEGKHVVLIDELWDNGRTLDRVKNIIIHDLGHTKDDITTCTLFLKKKEQPAFPLPDLYGLEMPGVWVVGYGLDDAQEKRGWSYLYGIPKADGVPLGPDDEMFAEGEKGENFYKNFREQIVGQLDAPLFGEATQEMMFKRKERNRNGNDEERLQKKFKTT